MSASTLFFDLDGTLVDSEAGIVCSIRHAFAELGRPAPAPQQLRGWIGPPLRDSFKDYFAGDQALVAQALALYRERYDAQGWREHTVFPEIGAAVAALAAAGHRFAVVTSKNERFARRIVATLPFAAHFEEIVGASDDGARRTKPDLIAEALRRLSLQPAQCVMIGDRRMDIDGANHHGMRSIGVLWGFGDEAELRQADAGALAQVPAQLPGLIA
ncbi:HAD-IA family hydrolase [Xanthomonas translucens]|uniref:HAD-IA family hydrolase n=1 Tax=Xanthomonas campestris pv. translucens TaxID=343 RepID=UPI0002A7A8D6|nr:HAD-IA family hydrolase [Xanthomonas translucens]AKK68659.1 HAD family hydrolase [Xanthomonas translucens pv. undulosa]AVY65835.1 HAD family hydrolase [Xanthomonas translucens pv. undulosa]ELQ07516.1 haloacid dehalogenase-like hydrolase [Xanthomonas translucens DAR61454]MBC3973500.1 HAD-IA family hydrolase [Xanthomonas translucens pv. undulosa]MCT8269429.1 HAD-IA family hydrolase [Xanthomonas translucens pv. undulosa]